MQQSAHEIAKAIKQFGSDQITGYATIYLSVTTMFVATVALFASSRTVARSDDVITRRTRAAVDSTSRARWVDAIRDDVFEMLSLLEERRAIDATDVRLESETAVRRDAIVARIQYLRYRMEFKSGSENLKQRELLKLLDHYSQL